MGFEQREKNNEQKVRETESLSFLNSNTSVLQEKKLFWSLSTWMMLNDSQPCCVKKRVVKA